MEPIEYLTICLDPVRLHILGAAAFGPVTAEEVSGAMGIGRREALKAVGSLRAAGLLAEDGRLVEDVLREIGATLPTPPAADSPMRFKVTGTRASAADPDVLAGDWSGDEIAVLSIFFSGARLTEIPASRTKRLVILERLAQEFEPGVRYDEREVSFRLQMFHPDYAALRRYLVDESFLTRSEGVYWRTGGRYESRFGADR